MSVQIKLTVGNNFLFPTEVNLALIYMVAFILLFFLADNGNYRINFNNYIKFLTFKINVINHFFLRDY